MNVDVNVSPASTDALLGAPAIAAIGVVGAGQMGSGIAHVCALGGLPVVLLDVKAEALDKAIAVIGRNMDRQIGRNLITPAEKEDVKRAIYKVLTPHLKPSCMLATNTSSISITRLGASTDRAEKFIGMHFMNPVPVMKLVEVIRGIATDEPTFQAIQALAEKLHKTSAVAEDFPAFIVNRILVPMINEAVYALYEGVGSITAIDNAMRLGANHPMGPLELADFIGLDTCLSIMQVLYEGLSDSKYRPCPLLVKYVEAGWLGRKTGRGFYDYGQTPPRQARPSSTCSGRVTARTNRPRRPVPEAWGRCRG